MSRLRLSSLARPAIVVVVLAGVLAVVVGVVRFRSASTPAAAETAAPASQVETASVERRDLAESTQVDGTLGYGDATAVAAGKPGTVTGEPALGAVVERGQPIFQIDGKDVRLLYGAVPLYRALDVSVSKGADVRQLEENLQALGHTEGLYFTVDETFDNATRIAVERWQRATAQDVTGTVAPGDAVFLPGAARIAEHTVEVGSQANPGGPVLSTTATERLVTVRLDATKQNLAHVGDRVDVELPDGASVGGTIASIGTVATADDNGDGGGGGGGNGDGSSGTPKVTVTITLADASATGTLDQAPVTVSLHQTIAEDVLTVPVAALLALKEGGYAVEVVAPNGTTKLAKVTPSSFAKGMVAITGAVNVGDTVRVAG